MKAIVKNLLVLALALAGCAGSVAPAFDARFAVSRSQQASVLESLGEAVSEPRTSPVLVAVTHAAHPELVLYDLGRSVRWRVPVRARSRPELLGDIVLTTEGDALLAFDKESGKRRFSVALDGCAYLGAARAGARLVFSCSIESRGGARVVALDAGTGARHWLRDAQGGEVGRPAAAHGLAFVPFQRQNLVVLDLDDGTELTRLRSRDDVVEWVVARGGAVFFGQRSLYQLSAGYRGTRASTPHLPLPTRFLPGAPALFESAFQPRPAERSARGRVAVLARPEAAPSAVGLTGDRFYLVFYRYIFAFDGKGTLRWCRVLAHDTVGGEATSAGLVVLSERGRVELLDKQDGASTFAAESGLSIGSAVVAASSLAGSAAQPARSLTEDLTEVALDADTRLVPARIFAVGQLGELQDPEVTRALLEIYRHTSAAPELTRAVADVLQQRRTGLEHLIDALLARYDFLEQTRPAPLIVIAAALTAARDPRGVPRLLERIEDHETPLAALPSLIRAVGELGDAAALAPLGRWLSRYRADSSFRQYPEPLLEAARVLLRHGSGEERALLAALPRDGLAHPALVAELEKLMRQEPVRMPGTAVAAVADGVELPAQLTQRAVDETFAEHVDEVRACILEELGRNPKLAQVRVAFIAESDGSTHAHAFAPNTPAFVDCLYPKVAAFRLPPFRSGRTVARYVVSLAKPAAAPPPAADEGPWWRERAERPRRIGAGRGEPWWRSRQALAPLVGVPHPTPIAPPPPATPSEDAWWTPAAPP